ncbi:MAG: hypothetical protein K2R98_32145 [Gemmataceae bacterium]|nr:hypothetical protein [Gemmataceae bacterium]
MRITKAKLLRGAFHVAILALIGYLIFGFARPSPATVALDDATYRVSGPYKHENLAVYLLHCGEQDPRGFVTLAEGLKTGAVKVTEKKDAEVNELVIENTGDDFLFLQEGDRVTGGQQDRTIFASFVVPPHSGQMPLPAFCVEQGRWTTGANGAKFGNAANCALAPKQVRTAAKVFQGQAAVWQEVANQKVVAAQAGLSTNDNTSLTETMDAPKVKKISDDFAAALNKVVADHPDAVGVAIVINGQIEEVNCYPNNQLLALQYPRLLQSYALQAVLEKDKAKKASVLSATDVARFMLHADQDAQKAQEAGSLAAARQTNRVMQQRQSPITWNAINGANQIEIYAEQSAQFGNLGGQFGNQGGANQAAYQPPTPPVTTRRNQAIDDNNKLEVVEISNVYNCKTEYQGKLVHRQFISRTQPQTQRDVQRGAPQQGLQNDVQQQRLEQNNIDVNQNPRIINQRRVP